MGSGRIYGSVTSNSNKFNFFLDWTSEINIEGNYSTVSVKTYWSPKSGWEYWDFDTSSGRNASININGSNYAIFERFSTGDNWSNGNPYFIMSHAVKVYHNDDGTKSITISARANGRASDGETSYGPSSSVYESGDCVVPETTITLDTIPRKSAVSCSTANIGAKPTITISRASSSFTHTLRYKFGSLSGTIVEKTTSTSYSSWTIPTTFYAQIPNDTYGTGTIYCDTYNGNTLIGTTETPFRANVANSNPTLNPTVEDTNSATLALTGDKNRLVRYYSNAYFNAGVAAINGASLKSTRVTNGANSSTATTGTFNKVESGEFVFSATDSRDLSTTKTLNKTLVPYIKLTCDIWLKTTSASGTISIGVSGNYFSGSFGAVTNTLQVQYRFKEEGGSYSAWTGISYYSDDNTYEVTITKDNLDYQKSYVIQARVVDKLNTITSKELPVSVLPVYDWGKEDFNLNVPLNMNGQTVLRHNKDANNLVVSASGGFIYFRPQGTSETTGEIKFSPQGNIELAGDIIINGKSLKSLLGI